MSTALPIACPAATEVHPPNTSPSVVCGVLENANRRAQEGQRGQVSALFDADTNPRTVHGFCAGPGIPGSPASYCSCAIWRAEKSSLRGRHALRDDAAARQGRIRG